MRGIAKKRAARYFLKDIVGMLELETTDAMISEGQAQLLLYPHLSALGVSQPFEARITRSLDWLLQDWGFGIVTEDTGLLHSGQRYQKYQHV